MTISRRLFASQSAYLASRCASWAGECAADFGGPELPMYDESIKRYLAMLRETADRIEQMHNEKS